MYRPGPSAATSALALALTLTLTCAWGSGCAGGSEDGGSEPETPLEEHACLNIARGTLIDVARTRDDARTIEVGREPYRVNLLPGEAGYLAFSTDGPAELALLIDFAGAVPAVWSGDERAEIEPGEPNPTCEEDLPEVDRLSVPGGAHWLEVGPAFQANVWLMLAPAG